MKFRNPPSEHKQFIRRRVAQFPIDRCPLRSDIRKIGTIQRRLAWPLHKDDTLFQSGRPSGLNIYFIFFSISVSHCDIGSVLIDGSTIRLAVGGLHVMSTPDIILKLRVGYSTKSDINLDPRNKFPFSKSRRHSH